MYTLSTHVLSECWQQSLVPADLPLLAANETNQDFGSILSPSTRHALTLKFSLSSSSSTHLLICSFPIFIPFLFLFTAPHHPSASPSFPSPLLARWLVYRWDGCRIKDVTLFFLPLHRSFSASLPSLILVSSHCGAFNASYHMAAQNSRRCRGAFIGVSKHSSNNACQGSEFFIMQRLDCWTPPPYSPKTPGQATQLLFTSVNT